jgi:hypothetical protein
MPPLCSHRLLTTHLPPDLMCRHMRTNNHSSSSSSRGNITTINNRGTASRNSRWCSEGDISTWLCRFNVAGGRLIICHSVFGSSLLFLLFLFFFWVCLVIILVWFFFPWFKFLVVEALSANLSVGLEIVNKAPTRHWLTCVVGGDLCHVLESGQVNWLRCTHT